MPMSPRLLRPRASGDTLVGGLDADAVTYLRAVRAVEGAFVEPAVQLAVSAFVAGCKTDGIWSAIKASCLLMGARTLSGALTPLVGTAPTNFNFVSGDYNRKTGLVGNGSTKYLDTNRLATAEAKDNFAHGVWVTSASYTAGNQALIGFSAGNVLGASHIVIRSTTNNDVLIRNRNNDSIGTTFSTATPSVLSGFFGQRRASSSTYSTRIGGVAADISQSSSDHPAVNQMVFVRTATDTFFASARIAWYFVGESLDLALLDSRVSTLVTSIGAAIP